MTHFVVDLILHTFSLFLLIPVLSCSLTRILRGLQTKRSKKEKRKMLLYVPSLFCRVHSQCLKVSLNLWRNRKREENFFQFLLSFDFNTFLVLLFPSLSFILFLRIPSHLPLDVSFGYTFDLFYFPSLHHPLKMLLHASVQTVVYEHESE